MQPSADDEQEVAGSFTITGDGKFECRVIDKEGQASQQSFCGTVTMLSDQSPVRSDLAAAAHVAGHADGQSARGPLGRGRLRHFAAATFPQPERFAAAAAGHRGSAGRSRAAWTSRCCCRWPATAWSRAT